MQMFGIPMSGPDTCGFYGSTPEDELCARWIQLATFFPFARQNRDDEVSGTLNEPYVLALPYKKWAINAIKDRLQYSRLMYTCLFEASVSGETCFDPLMFHWPEDEQTFVDPEHSIIVANAIKVTPVLVAGATTVKSYFPAGTWFNMRDLSAAGRIDSLGEWKVLVAPNGDTDTVLAHLRTGTIIPFQNGTD